MMPTSIQDIVPYKEKTSMRIKQLVAEESAGNMTQFAKMVGLSKQAINKWIDSNKPTLPNLDGIMRIAVAFRVSPLWLLFGEGPKEMGNVRGANHLYIVPRGPLVNSWFSLYSLWFDMLEARSTELTKAEPPSTTVAECGFRTPFASKGLLSLQVAIGPSEQAILAGIKTLLEGLVTSERAKQSAEVVELIESIVQIFQGMLENQFMAFFPQLWAECDLKKPLECQLIQERCNAVFNLNRLFKEKLISLEAHLRVINQMTGPTDHPGP